MVCSNLILIRFFLKYGHSKILPCYKISFKGLNAVKGLSESGLNIICFTKAIGEEITDLYECLQCSVIISARVIELSGVIFYTTILHITLHKTVQNSQQP
jgi:hypothetical protein